MRTRAKVEMLKKNKHKNIKNLGENLTKKSAKTAWKKIENLIEGIIEILNNGE